MKIYAWISAFRLRTLPLALSSIGMGSFLAASNSIFRFDVLLWSALTTVFLQILSNLANDYGDTVNGADNEHRVGPVRAVQSGALSVSEIKMGIAFFVVLSLVSGLFLLSITVGIGTPIFYWFLGFGILSIIAAYTYTAGSRPYGYAGLGDIMVLVFFGLLGVGGSYFLYDLTISYDIILPSIAMGALATGVLNINNMRDINSDVEAGKQTIPVRFGKRNAVIYHWSLIIMAILLSGAFIFIQGLHYASSIWLLGLPLLILNAYKISGIVDHKDFDPYLKQLALSTFAFMLFFGLSLIIR
jgi:1,4-dihydroxy-2-naphthoate octaprenyltransferase